MFPTPKDVHVDAALTGMSVGFKNQMFIADRIFPFLPVSKQSDYYFVFRKGDWFRNEARIRGPGTKGARSGYKLTTAQYVCEEYTLGHPIPYEVVENADEVLEPFETGVNFTSNGVLLKLETLVSTLVTTAGNWTSSEDVAGGWAAGDGNTFIEDVLGGMRTIRRIIGVYPNAMMIESKTFEELKQESTLLDRIKYTGTQGRPADVTPAMIAAMFELDEVVIGGSIYSSDEETVAGTEFTAVDLWETNATKGSAFLYYRTPTPAPMSPTAGYIFNWTRSQNYPKDLVRRNGYREVRRWWEAPEKQWVVECAMCVDPVAAGADAGYLFYDTIVT